MLYSEPVILVFDIEATDLFGDAIAIGGVLMNKSDGKVLSKFGGRCPMTSEPTVFVKEYVLPAIQDLKSYDHQEDLFRAFWEWYYKMTHDEGDMLDNVDVFVDFGYPLEARFLYEIQKLVGKYWNGPYPLHEVSTLLLAIGVTPHVSRLAWPEDQFPWSDQNFTIHNPVDDSIMSGHTVIKALRALASREFGMF